MARTKQQPKANVQDKKLKEFFKEVTAKSTPNLPSSAESSKPGSSVDAKSSKAISTIADGASQGTSRKSSTRRSLTRRSTSGNGSSRTSSARTSTPRPKKRRAPGVAALQEIRRLQRSTHLLIPTAAFVRVVRDVLLAEEEKRRLEDAGLRDGFLLQGMRFSADAIACLHEAAEVQLTNFFTLSYYCTRHARRQTLMVRDCQLTRLILGRNDPINP